MTDKSGCDKCIDAPLVESRTTIALGNHAHLSDGPIVVLFVLDGQTVDCGILVTQRTFTSPVNVTATTDYAYEYNEEIFSFTSRTTNAIGDYTFSVTITSPIMANSNFPDATRVITFSITPCEPYL